MQLLPATRSGVCRRTTAGSSTTIQRLTAAASPFARRMARPRRVRYSRAMEGHDDGLDALERYLESAEILTWGEVVSEGGHPEKHRVVLAGGVQVMAKPGHDQFEGVVKREAAGWQVAKYLGFTGLVAGTVLRDVPRLSTGVDVLSSIQVTWPDGREWLTALDRFSEDETWQAAVFDAVVAHTDHNQNNWFGVPHPNTGAVQHLRLVDTGNAFGTSAPNSSFCERHRDQVIPDYILEGIGQLCGNWPPSIEELLGEDEARHTRELADQLLRDGALRIS
jgi:hypothetical protein